MAILDILIDECQGLVSAMEHDAAVQIAREAGQALYPTVEAWLKLCPRWYCHHDAADGVERLLDTSHDNLAAQSIEEALVELPPELRRYLGVHVHADDNL